MSLQIAERSSPTFDDVPDDPEWSSTLSAGMFLLDASLAVDDRILVEEKESRESCGPVLQIGGRYIRLSAGGWARGGR